MQESYGEYVVTRVYSHCNREVTIKITEQVTADSSLQASDQVADLCFVKYLNEPDEWCLVVATIDPVLD